MAKMGRVWQFGSLDSWWTDTNKKAIFCVKMFNGDDKSHKCKVIFI